MFFLTGKYQLKQAILYLGELLQDRDRDDLSDIPLQILREEAGGTKTIKVDIRSRNMNSQLYKYFVPYEPNNNSVDELLGYSCQCAKWK